MNEQDNDDDNDVVRKGYKTKGDLSLFCAQPRGDEWATEISPSNNNRHYRAQLWRDKNGAESLFSSFFCLLMIEHGDMNRKREMRDEKWVRWSVKKAFSWSSGEKIVLIDIVDAAAWCNGIWWFSVEHYSFNGIFCVIYELKLINFSSNNSSTHRIASVISLQIAYCTFPMFDWVHIPYTATTRNLVLKYESIEL